MYHVPPPPCSACQATEAGRGLGRRQLGRAIRHHIKLFFQHLQSPPVANQHRTRAIAREESGTETTDKTANLCSRGCALIRMLHSGTFWSTVQVQYSMHLRNATYEQVFIQVLVTF